MASRKSKKKKTAVVAAKAYVATEAECKVLSKVIAQLKQAMPYAPAKIEKEQGCIRVSWDHPDQAVALALWASAIGTTDFPFAGSIIEQLAQISRTGVELIESEFNSALSLMRGLAPTDPTEALLAAQMVAVHNATMVAAGRLARAENPAQQESASTSFNKLARTFAAQVEALKRYRLKGEQTIRVQHVTVNDGGRAIVGDVQHTTGGLPKKEGQSHELTTPDALGPALLGPIQTNGTALPGSGGQRKARVPIPRRSCRSAEGPHKRRLSPRAPHQ